MIVSKQKISFGFVCIKLAMSPKLSGYEDVWRHTWDVCVFLDFDTPQYLAKCKSPNANRFSLMEFICM